MRLHLIRHGQTHGNVLGALDTVFPGADLTDLGRDQAQSLVSRIGDQGFESIWVSNLARTQQTADPLAKYLDLPLHVREGLREIDAGNLEGLNDESSVHTYINTVISWMGGDLDLRMGDGVSGQEVLRRFNEVIAEIERTGHQKVAVVAHGAVIPFWVSAHTHGFDHELYPENRLKNTDIVVLEGSLEGGYRLERWADLDFTSGV